MRNVGIMTKSIVVSKRTILILSLPIILLLYFLLFPPPPLKFPSETDREIAQRIYEDLTVLTEQVGITGIEIPQNLPIDRLKKLQEELLKILAKTYLIRPCVQYALIATQDGYYPSYNTGRMIFFKKRRSLEVRKNCKR